MTAPVAILAILAIIVIAIIVISVKLHRVSKNVADTVTWSGGGGGGGGSIYEDGDRQPSVPRVNDQ